jgi:hypothetical protein
MVVLKNLTSCAGISSRNQNSASREKSSIILNEQSGSEGTYEISPSSLVTQVTFSAPLEENTTLNFVVNNMNAYVGDEMVWIIDITNVETITINLPIKYFYYTQCGEVTESLNSDDLYTSILVLPWFFDGESWISTWDNC